MAETIITWGVLLGTLGLQLAFTAFFVIGAMSVVRDMFR